MSETKWVCADLEDKTKTDVLVFKGSDVSGSFKIDQVQYICKKSNERDDEIKRCVFVQK